MRFTGTSIFLPEIVRGTSGITNTSLGAWRADSRVRIASSSDAFSAAGTSGASRAAQVIVLSARSEKGLEAATDQRITRRLILQPRLEAGVGIDGGLDLHEAEAGLRLRYEFRPEFAPYVGWVWSRRPDASHGGGDEAETRSGLVVGLTAWF